MFDLTRPPFYVRVRVRFRGRGRFRVRGRVRGYIKWRPCYIEQLPLECAQTQHTCGVPLDTINALRILSFPALPLVGHQKELEGVYELLIINPGSLL